MNKITQLLVVALALPTAALGLSACGSSSGDCTVTLRPGADDQTAANMAFVGARAGDTICFAPGTYRYSDPIEARGLAGLTVRGLGATAREVILDFRGQEAGAKGLSFTLMSDLLIEHLTVENASGDDVFVSSATGVTFRDVHAGWSDDIPMDRRGRYALYPVESTNVLIEDSEAYGSSDAGIYVGQTTNCIVRDSVARDNVAGIEIENSTNCEVYGNTAMNNTGGILIFELPGLPMHGTGTEVRDNTITSNNLANFAAAGTIVSFVPSGTGIMVLAANDVEIHSNAIQGNNTVAAMVLSYQTAQFAGAPMANDPTYDPFSEQIWVYGNTTSGNGTRPDPVVAALAGMAPFPDVIWDGYVRSGMGENTMCVAMTTLRDIDGDNDFMTRSDDVSMHMCTRTTRAPVVIAGR
jgi:parallel beta-helix repeat protein